MSKHIKTTFKVLGESPNVAAVATLIAALDIADDEVQALVVGTLLERRSTPGIVEIIRRIEQLPPAASRLVDKSGAALSRALRDCLLNDDPTLRGNALELVRRLEIYSELPTLISLLQAHHVIDRGAVAGVILELVNRLYERLRSGWEGDDSQPFLSDSERIRQQMMATLEAAGYRYSAHRCRAVIEGLLILADPEDMHLKKFIRDAAEESRGVAAELMCSSRHPGVMQLVVDSLTQNYPFPAAYAALEQRTDPEFICHLMRHWPRKPTAFQQKNLREIRSVAWLEPERMELDCIPAALHRALVAFLMTTGLPQSQKLVVLEWMVRFGSPEGRLAATDVLCDLEDDKVQEVVLEGLESQEPEVQAWATSQLRTWAIPNAMELLIERLDSPIPEVREAARNELVGFDIYRVLETFNDLDPRVQVAAGQLVRKIDPDAISKLRDEMQNATRRKRIRAARAALAMKLHLEVVEALMTMARDSDNLVRRTAAEILGRVPTREAVEMLLSLTHDLSPRVRDTAAEALLHLQGHHADTPNLHSAALPQPAGSPEALP